MAETKLFNSLGLCRRAGKCQSGEFAVERAVKAGKSKLVPEVGRAIGREGHVVMAVTDMQFMNMILGAMASETEVGG